MCFNPDCTSAVRDSVVLVNTIAPTAVLVLLQYHVSPIRLRIHAAGITERLS